MYAENTGEFGITTCGLAYAKLIDFDNNGIDELYVHYLTMENEHYSENTLQEEIWEFDGTNANKIYEYKHTSNGSHVGNSSGGINLAKSTDGKVYFYSKSDSMHHGNMYGNIILNEVKDNELVNKIAMSASSEIYYIDGSDQEFLRRRYSKYYYDEVIEATVDEDIPYNPEIDASEDVTDNFYSRFENYNNEILEECKITEIEELVIAGAWEELSWTLDTSLISELEAKLPYQAPVKEDVSTYLPYVGDFSKLNMTVEQAESLKNIIEENIAEDNSRYQHGILFDSGDGVPGLVIEEKVYVLSGDRYVLLPRQGSVGGIYFNIGIYENTTVLNNATWQRTYIGGSEVHLYYEDLRDLSKIHEYVNIEFFQESGGDDYIITQEEVKRKLSNQEVQFEYGFTDADSKKLYVIDWDGFEQKIVTGVAPVVKANDEIINIDYINGKAVDALQLDDSSKISDFVDMSYAGKMLYSLDVGNDGDSELVSNSTLLEAIKLFIAQSDEYFVYQNLTQDTTVVEKLKNETKISEEITGIYKVSDSIFYVICGDVGYIVKLVIKNGEQVYIIDKETTGNLKVEELAEYIVENNSKNNITIDFSKINQFENEANYVTYLREILSNVNGLTLTDSAKQDVTKFIEMALTNFSVGTIESKKNEVTLTSENIRDAIYNSNLLQGLLDAELSVNETTLNKIPSVAVKFDVTKLNINKPIEITIDSSILSVVSNQMLQFILSDNQYMLEIDTANLADILNGSVSITIEIEKLEDNNYSIQFFDARGELIEKLPAQFGFMLPATTELSTLMMTSGANTDNWGGQYDANLGSLKFNTSISGTYEIIDQEIIVNDLDGYTEEEVQIIKFMISKGFLNLDENNNFNPTDTVLRYDFTQALVSMFFSLDREIKTTFPDVDESSEYYAYIASAEHDELITGYEDGEFKGENEVLIEEVLAIVARALENQKDYVYPTNPDEYLTTITMVNQAHPWAQELIALCVREGIVDQGETIAPLSGATRIESAIYLYRLFMLLNQTELNEGLILTDIDFSVIYIAVPCVLLLGGVATVFAIKAKKNKKEKTNN